jgi:hypothetical protein
MTWEAIGAVADVVAAIAVVASIFYLAVQIRNNTVELEQQSRQHELSSLVAIETCFSQFRSMIAINAQVAAVWNKAMRDLNDLNAEERTQADYLIREFFWSWANFWIKVHRGDFRKHDVMFDETSKEIVLHLKRPGIRQWWQEGVNRELFFSEFTALIDRVIVSNESDA